MRFPRAPAALFALLTLTALPTLAAPPEQPLSAADEDKRTRLFREGKSAADAGDWALAADKFRKVVEMRSAPKALIALGIAEEKQGHLVAALAAYKQAREEAADQALTDDLKTANAALEGVRPRIPRFVFTPEDALLGATLTLDGAPATLQDSALLTDPGRHTIEATAEGKGTFRTTITVGESEEREIGIVYSPSSAGSGDPGPSPPDKTPVSPPPTSAIVVAAAGVALAGAGAALYGIGSGDYDKAALQCTGVVCPPAARDAGNAARGQIIAGDILLIAGGAAVAAGVVVWIVSATGKKKSPPPVTSLFVAPRPAGLTLGGRF
ncbi:MAG: hypothetical protein R3B70_35970 [Polyangiaceae bacterium]